MVVLSATPPFVSRVFKGAEMATTIGMMKPCMNDMTHLHPNVDTFVEVLYDMGWFDDGINVFCRLMGGWADCL
jgi:hypothetical protein